MRSDDISDLVAIGKNSRSCGRLFIFLVIITIIIVFALIDLLHTIFADVKCDDNCDMNYGCWGAGPRMCVRCSNYSVDGKCSMICPSEGLLL